MSECSDIRIKFDSSKRGPCRRIVESSPWSICFDPKWEHNVWGGDTHECRTFLCQQCAEKLLKLIEPKETIRCDIYIEKIDALDVDAFKKKYGSAIRKNHS